MDVLSVAIELEASFVVFAYQGLQGRLALKRVASV
jgi:hypothetical protein